MDILLRALSVCHKSINSAIPLEFGFDDINLFCVRSEEKNSRSAIAIIALFERQMNKSSPETART